MIAHKSVERSDCPINRRIEVKKTKLSAKHVCGERDINEELSLLLSKAPRAFRSRGKEDGIAGGCDLVRETVKEIVYDIFRVLFRLCLEVLFIPADFDGGHIGFCVDDIALFVLSDLLIKGIEGNCNACKIAAPENIFKSHKVVILEIDLFLLSHTYVAGVTSEHVSLVKQCLRFL